MPVIRKPNFKVVSINEKLYGYAEAMQANVQNSEGSTTSQYKMKDGSDIDITIEITRMVQIQRVYSVGDKDNCSP